MITDKNQILFIRQNNTPCYSWEYCLNILKNNPIREGEQEYFKGLKEIGWFGFSKEVWVYVWDLYFKEHKQIMVYYPNTNDFYYIDKNLNEIKTKLIV